MHGTAATDLLDSYHTERHTAGANILADTRAQALLGTTDPGLDPLKDLLTRLLARPDGNRALAETVTGLDTSYDMGADDPGTHPWLGRLVPDLRLHTGNGRTRLRTLLTPGRPVLLALAGERGRDHDTARTNGIDATGAQCPDHPDVDAVLIRPDGHAAWVRTADGAASGDLDRALRRWCAPERPRSPETATIR